MTKFPKYHELVCNTYTPNFTAGSTNCTLQQGDVTRSRLVAGGTFFRSVNNGAVENVNNIILECIVTPTTGNVEEVVFKITGADGSLTTIPTFTQEYNLSTGSCLESGISQLRTKLDSNTVVNMPITDTIQPWAAGTDDADCLLTSFGPTNLSGAAVLPNDITGIRTGPAYTLYHVMYAETAADGSLTLINTPSEWDGEKWVTYPSPLYPAGSGSPALCGI